MLTAIDAFINRGGQVPSRPLVIDLGCGPATCGFAIADWLRANESSASINYIGVDDSREFLNLGRELVSVTNSGIARQQFAPAVQQITSETLSSFSTTRNGIIFTASYVLHQPFMADCAPLIELMRRVRNALPNLPAWLFCQDANFSDTGPTDYVRIWPENRIAYIASEARQIGYNISSWKYTYRERPTWLTQGGEFASGSERATDNLCEFLQKIA